MFHGRQPKKRENYIVFIRNLNYEATEEDLKTFLKEQLGEKVVGKCIIVRDNEKKSRGFGYAYLKSQVDQKRCLTIVNGKEHMGRKLHITEYNPTSSEKSKSKEKKKQPFTKHIVAIHGLSKRLNVKQAEKELKKLFSKFGEITTIRIPSENNVHRSYAFVHFKKPKSAKKAIKELNGTKLKGRELILDHALPKEEYLKQREMVAKQLEELEKQKGDEKEEEEGEEEEEENEEDEEEIEDNEEDENESIEEGESSEDWSDDPNDINDEDLDQMNDEESEDEESDDEKERKRKHNKPKRGAERTFFIQNVPLDAEEQELKALFEEKYGDVEYALFVRNKQTDSFLGKAFVRFRTEKAYNKMFKDLQTAKRIFDIRNETLLKKPTQPRRGYTIDGLKIRDRDLYILPALEREEAEQLSTAKDKKKNKDPKNLKLLNELRLDEDEMKSLPRKHVQKVKQLRLFLTAKVKNPNFKVSRTRLCIRNLAKNVTEKELKKILQDAIREVAQPNQFMKPYITQVKIVREKAPELQRRSKGYAFVQFNEHLLALLVLRKINNKVQLRKKLLIVHFAVDDVRKLKALERSMEIGRTKQPLKKSKFTKIGEVSFMKKQRQEMKALLKKEKEEKQKLEKEAKRNKSKKRKASEMDDLETKYFKKMKANEK